MGKPPHRWTEEEREILRREPSQTHEARRQLAARLGVTEGVVEYQATKMGLHRARGGRTWTTEEEKKLLELVERKPVTQIARILNRSINSVTVRAKKLNASRRSRNGWYTLGETAEMLGASQPWVRRRIENGSLRATQHYEDRRPQARGRPMHIEERDLRQFIRSHPQDLNGRNVDMVQIVQILSGLASPARAERNGNDAPGRGNEGLTPLSIRTSDGRHAFGMEPGTGETPPALVMLSQEPGLTGIWKTQASIGADELAQMLEGGPGLQRRGPEGCMRKTEPTGQGPRPGEETA